MPVASRPLSRADRAGLVLVAALGFLVANGAFLYGVLFMPGALVASLANPVSLGFIVEAMLLMVFGAVLVKRLAPSRIGWLGFVVLSLIGSIAFALPVLLLTPRKE